MKNTKKTIIIMFVALLAVSCSKEETITPQKNVTENSMQFLLNGERLIGMNEIEWTEETHFVQLENVNLAFDSDEKFLLWAKSNSYGAEISDKFNQTNEFQETALEAGIIDDEEATLAYMEQLNVSNSTNRVGATMLFDRTNHRSLLTIYGGFTFSFGPYRNKVESIIPSGFGVLFDKTWFRGASLWYGFAPVKDLGWFKNRAESMI